ncbi:MAG: phenylalanine--tRNA ligase subunit alpha, partial [Actinomycetota bacterium]|nr:phenylalanine--tRNA ligase subunit alpha [Actinomycetota bacterium]
MTPDLDQHLAEAATAVAAAGDLDALRTVDSELLGKQSVVTEARKTLGGLDEDERKAVGRRLNEVRVEIEALVAARRSALEGEARAEQLEEERLDLTELDRGRRLGHRHVVTQTWERLEDLFVGMGYTVSEGPEIEDEWHNFGALNFPPDHPARDMYDTLYVDHGEPGSTLL